MVQGFDVKGAFYLCQGSIKRQVYSGDTDQVSRCGRSPVVAKKDLGADFLGSLLAASRDGYVISGPPFSHLYNEDKRPYLTGSL